uniref:Bestrophin homolog n=1 Tax=Ascaris suum TaxID=6253 RepID=F1L4A4_ASCSU
MTISYQLDLSRASAISFFRLLFRWRASLWKNVFKEFLVWCTLYFLIAFCYRSPFIMTDAQRLIFEDVSSYLNKQLSFLPLTFILGFYVSTIASRWTIIFTNMGYIESEALLIGNYVQGDDEETKMQRRAMVRYMCLSQLLVYRDISVRVRKRFPTYDAIVQAGFMLEHEREKLESIKLDYDKYWVPINWSYTHMFEARRAGKITSDVMTNKLTDEMKVFRTNLQMLCNYDWVPIPLVYPQVIMIAVYFYFGVCLISRQFILSGRDLATKSEIDIVVPVMTMVQFLFYVGWMKAAEVILNPMGDDDDDFECNFLLDKNLATSLSIVDETHYDAPTVQEDKFWSSGHVDPMYPSSTDVDEVNPLIGSAIHAKIPSVNDEQKPVEMIPRRSSTATISNSRKTSRKSLSRRMSSLFKVPASLHRKRMTIAQTGMLGNNELRKGSVQLDDTISSRRASVCTVRSHAATFPSARNSIASLEREPLPQCHEKSTASMINFQSALSTVTEEEPPASRDNSTVVPPPAVLQELVAQQDVQEKEAKI